MKKNLNSLITLFIFAVVIFYSGCSEDSEIVDPPEEHFEAIGVYLHNSGIAVASILRGVTDDTLFASVGDLTDHISVQFYNDDEEITDPPTGGQTLAFEIGDTSIVSVFQDEGEEGGFEFHLRGKNTGITDIELFIMHEGHADFRSGNIPVKVNE